LCWGLYRKTVELTVPRPSHRPHSQATPRRRPSSWETASQQLCHPSQNPPPPIDLHLNRGFERVRSSGGGIQPAAFSSSQSDASLAAKGWTPSLPTFRGSVRKVRRATSRARGRTTAPPGGTSGAPPPRAGSLRPSVPQHIPPNQSRRCRSRRWLSNSRQVGSMHKYTYK